MISQRGAFIALAIITSMAFSSIACGLGSDPDNRDVTDPSSSGPEVPEGVSQIGEKRILAYHEVTLVGVEYYPSERDDDDYPEILVAELFIENILWYLRHTQKKTLV